MNTSLTNNLEPKTMNPEPTTDYPEPSPEMIEDIRKRLTEANIPQDVMERAHHTLMHDTIDAAGRLLYRAGLCLCSAELYEYRKTLFPPNSLLDPLTAGAPVLRPEFAQSPQPNSELQTANHEPPSPAPITDSLITTPGASLLNDLRDVIKRFLVMPDMAAETLALWIVHTYAFTLRQVTTYIGVVSPEKRCGKTTLLELLGRLANRSLTAANISSSALFRVIERTQPTLLIDEADTFLQGRDELAGILNAGYRRGNSYVVRVAEGRDRHPVASAVAADCHNTSPKPEFAEWTNDYPDNTQRNPEPGTANPEPHGLVRYSCWCPKVMAAIGRLPDTLADRCIIITMQRKMPGEKCERMRELNAVDYRKRCADFVHEHREAIAQARPETPPGLNDRAADIWEPLLAIADLAGGEWPQLARAAAQKLSASDDEMTLVAYFLKDLRNFMVLSKTDRMLSREIVAAFNPMHNRPWEDLRRGREINEWWLGRLLSQLGLQSKNMRTNDTLGKGYLLAEIEAAFRRYVPNPDAHMAQPTVAEQLTGDINIPKNHETQMDAQIDKMMKQFLSTLPKEP